MSGFSVVSYLFNTPVYEHCVVIAIANAIVYIVRGLQIMIIRNYEISRGIERGVL